MRTADRHTSLYIWATKPKPNIKLNTNPKPTNPNPKVTLSSQY